MSLLGLVKKGLISDLNDNCLRPLLTHLLFNTGAPLSLSNSATFYSFFLRSSCPLSYVMQFGVDGVRIDIV